VQINPNSDSKFPAGSYNIGLQRIVSRITQSMQRDTLVQDTTNRLRASLDVDRVVLYYFFRQWEGRVTFESVIASKFSILGTTGPDECFNGDYAAMYEEGRVKAIADIDQEPIADCHREFLREMNVRANLVVPVLTAKGLWGLLVAHHCQSVRDWSELDIQLLQSAAKTLSAAPSVQSS
jgi:GAF domain-containing protein